MESALSVVLNTYFFASECSYRDTYRFQLKCPACLEPVILRKGVINTPHFAHQNETLFIKKYCPLRTGGEYSSAAEFERETYGQTLLKHFKYFSIHFDQFINLNEDNLTVYTTQNSIDKIRLYLNRHYKENIYVQELLRPNMQDFFNNTVRHYLQKRKLPNKVMLYVTDNNLESIINNYLKLIEFFQEYFYNNRKWDFREEGKKHKELYSIDEDIISKFYHASVDSTSYADNNNSNDKRNINIKKEEKFVYTEEQKKENENLVNKILNDHNNKVTVKSTPVKQSNNINTSCKYKCPYCKKNIKKGKLSSHKEIERKEIVRTFLQRQNHNPNKKKINTYKRITLYQMLLMNENNNNFDYAKVLENANKLFLKNENNNLNKNLKKTEKNKNKTNK